MRSPVITQSPPSSIGSLLVTEMILQDTEPQPPEVLTPTVTGTNSSLGGQRTLGLAVRLVMLSGGQGTVQVMTT